MNGTQLMQKNDDSSPHEQPQNDANADVQNGSKTEDTANKTTFDVMQDNIDRILDRISEKDNTVDEKELDDLLDHLESTSKEIYQTEVERENSILQQASNMQSAFSFVTAGLVVLAQIVCDHNTNENLWIIIAICFSVVAALLMLSLVLATKAQTRFIRENGPPSVVDIIDQANEDFEAMMNKYTRYMLKIETFNGLYSDLRKVNDLRVRLVEYSMRSFYLALALSIISAIILAFVV